MNEVVLRKLESAGSEVVLDGGVHLNDVASFAAHIQVQDASRREFRDRAGLDREHMRPVLKHAAGLGRVYGQVQFEVHVAEELNCRAVFESEAAPPRLLLSQADS